MRSSSSQALALLCAALLLAGCAGAPSKAPARKPAAQAPARPAPVARTPAAPATGAYAEALKLLKANQLAEAEKALLAIAKANPQASGPQTNLGILYARSNRKPQARAAFARAVALNPANAIAHTWAGVLAREAGELAQAEQSYRAALAADPAYAPAQFDLAILYDLYLKRPADALAAYRKYAELTGRKDARVAVWIGELEAGGTAAPAGKTAGGTQP